jgi:predicted metal-binding protein
VSYEGTVCPCGDKKPPGTMLCDDCVAHLAHRPEMAQYQDKSLCVDLRKNAAIILITLAKGRKTTPNRGENR